MLNGGDGVGGSLRARSGDRRVSYVQGMDCSIINSMLVYRTPCTGSVRRRTSRDPTVAGQCVVVEATRQARSRSSTAASASTTGAATSSVRLAPRSSRSTDVADSPNSCIIARQSVARIRGRRNC